MDCGKVEPSFPATFTEDELADPWVRVRPNRASAFHIRFFEETPIRMFVPAQIKGQPGTEEAHNKAMNSDAFFVRFAHCKCAGYGVRGKGERK